MRRATCLLHISSMLLVLRRWIPVAMISSLPFLDTKYAHAKKEAVRSTNTDRLTRRKVHNPHSTIRFVNMLPSCSFGPECIYTQIFWVHFNLYLGSEKIKLLSAHRNSLRKHVWDTDNLNILLPLICLPATITGNIHEYCDLRKLKKNKTTQHFYFFLFSLSISYICSTSSTVSSTISPI